MLHIGIVGMGGIGNNHARCYTAHENAKVVAVCDMIKEQADQAAASYGARAFYSVEEMVASGLRLDACSVTTAGVENGGDHYEPTMALLQAGIPVLGEKPISNEIPKARQMVALAAEKELPYGINLNHRFTPAAVKAKEWLTNGRLGALQMVNMTMWINNPNESSPWFHIRALHPHSLDVMSYFAGGVDRVHAFFKKGKGRQIWSNVQANLLYEDGVIGHLTGVVRRRRKLRLGDLGIGRLGGADHHQRSLREADVLPALFTRGGKLRSPRGHGRFCGYLSGADQRVDRRFAKPSST